MPRKPRFQHRKDKERKTRLERAKPPSPSPIVTTEQPTSTSLIADLSTLTIPNGWACQTANDKHSFCKLSQLSSSSATPMSVIHTVTVLSDFTWSLHVYSHKIDASTCTALKQFPSRLTSELLLELLTTLDRLSICAGQPDQHFIEMIQAKKGKILSNSGQAVAYLDSFPVKFNGTAYLQTIRSSNCHLIGNVVKCEPCKSYRDNLRAIYNRWKKRCTENVSPTCSHTNDRYLNTPEKKAKISKLRNKARSAKQDVKKLRQKIQEMSERFGNTIDDELHKDLISIMKSKQEQVNKAYPEGSFARLFWEEQLKAASVSNSRQMRWHPTMIKWCLNLMLISSSAYQAMRSSGFVKLPSDRTLRDYMKYFENKTGFQDEVDQQLTQEVSSLKLPEYRKYFGLLLDEMKIKEGLVYNKHSGKIIGFTELGDINDDLLTLEQEGEHPDVAKYVLVVMVRGTLCKFEFPYAHFGTRGITADLLYPIVDEAVYRLEARGLKVISVTADGASPNRKFFKMFNSEKTTLSHKTSNAYSPDGKRPLFFFVDPPHLIKTVRNCWSKSGISGTRHMQVNGQYIEWKQLWSLYEKLSDMAVSSQGISLLPKLKREHLQLTSFSKMRVDLAAQVLSKSVSNAFAYFNDPTTTETQKFVLYFDRFFDCLNVRNLTEWQHKKKCYLKPYRSTNDERLNWLQSDFLKYLQDWEDSAKSKSELDLREQNKMMLSRETLEGIRITVNSFIEMTKYLLSQGEELFFLSERISQDPIENYFGKQRARGGRNEHPNLQQCVHNAAALRVQKSFALNPVRGNCRRKRRNSDSYTIDDTPLPKRKRV